MRSCPSDYHASKRHMSRLSCGQNFYAFFVRSQKRMSRPISKLLIFIHRSCTQNYYKVFISNIDILGRLLWWRAPVVGASKTNETCSMNILVARGANHQVFKTWFFFAASAMFYNPRREIFQNKATVQNKAIVECKFPAFHDLQLLSSELRFSS